MTHRPIIFTAEMARALWEGRKTETRRVIKQPPFGATYWSKLRPEGRGSIITFYRGIYLKHTVKLPCKVGDLEWVKEPWRVSPYWDIVKSSKLYTHPSVCYEAVGRGPCHGKLRPSIFMPCWASRMTIEIEDLWVKRLQDITPESALREGCDDNSIESLTGILNENWNYSVKLFTNLWNTIHARKPQNQWDANPWVLVRKFKVHKCNIDEMRKNNACN